jgi:Zn-dependent M28 family amino/carboxypeptidase
MSTAPIHADPDRLKAHVRTLAKDLTPRDADHPERLAPVADYIEAQLAPHTNRLTDQPYTVDGVTVRNVIARFGPETGARIVIGAHHDTAGPYPGADDNASGVAGLLELARLLDGADLSCPVDLVSYPLEEPPYFYTDQMGSAVYARALKKQDVAVRVMLSLEMIGYFTDDPNSQQFPLFVLRPFYPSEGNFIAVVGKWGWGQRRLVRTVRDGMQQATPLPVHSINAPRIVPGIAFSDHLNYWHAGYDAVMITDTAFYRNPHYHSPSDTPETLDYDRMAQVVDGVRGAINALGTK